MINQQFSDSQLFFEAFTSRKLDCIVLPGFAVPPVKHGHSQELACSCLYTFLFNVMDMPTAALPVTLVRSGEER